MGLKAAMEQQHAAGHRPMPGDSLPPLHEELTRRAMGASVPTADLESLIEEIHGLSAAMADVNALVADLNELLLMAPATPDWKAGLGTRLSSRKFWAFVAGLLTVIVTAWQTSPDPNVTISAIAVAVVGYVVAQAHEDSAKAKAQAAKASQ